MFFGEDDIALPFFHGNIANKSCRFFFVQKNGRTQQSSKVNRMIHYYLLNHFAKI